MIFLRIFAIFFFLAEVVFVIKSAVEYNRRYKAFVDFLRLESDDETLKAIGYVECYGEEYGLRKTVSMTDALTRLYARYDETKKAEYLEYADFLKTQRKSRWIIILAWIVVTPVLLGITFGKV